MKIVIIGGNGTVGGVASRALAEHGQALALSRSTTPAVDLEDPESVSTALEAVGPVDALVVAVGSAPFTSVPEATEDDFQAAFTGKPLKQLTVAARGLPHVRDGGSITLTSGIIGRERIAKGALGGMANGAIDAFVHAAAPEMPRGIRINAVSPNVLESSPGHHPLFPGFTPVSDELVGRAYIRAVTGLDSGRVFTV